VKLNHIRFFIVCTSLFFAVCLLSTPHICFAKPDPNIPDPLKPWVDWVLHHNEEQLDCIPEYNNAQNLHCYWPTALEITLNNKGGRFQQSWQVNHESWVSLPGSNLQWPKDIKVNGKTAIVISKNNSPKIQLAPGLHTVKGNFNWPQLPEYLQIPTQSALVTLTVENKKLDFPNIDESGRLWLKTTQQEEKIENRLKIESHRLIDDMIPPKVTIHITLDVAGAAREIAFGPIYSPEKMTPISLKSVLPAKLEQDARMRVQVRPGRYDFSLTLRHNRPLETLSFSSHENDLWPQEEIWSFSARPNLRLVEIEGPPAIDPMQTSLPKNWHRYPAYRLLPGETMVFKEIKRGDPEPAPDQLTLDRSLWLRFDGSGYTIQDVIEGKKNTNWRLEMTPKISLGRVAVDGKEQFITKRQGSEKAGIELRKGILNLTADSTFQGNIGSLPATGWEHDFQKVQGKLYLPPGWKLLNASGIDNIPRTWIKRWTLFDFFIVLIFTIAVAKLFSKPLAIISFITLVLIYHEPNAPRYIWLALLIGFALLKHLPDGKFKQAVKIYQLVAVIALVVIAIPYAIQALRVGIYPQLARPWASMTEYALRQEATPVHKKTGPEEQRLMEQSDIDQSVEITRDMAKKAKAPVKSLLSSASAPYYDRSQVMQFDPKTLTQTGPGMPKWEPFETFHFSWSGPVTRSQDISFALIGPKVNLGLAFVRVFLIILLALGMIGIGYQRGQGFQFKIIKSLIMLPCLVLFLLYPCIGHTTDIPSKEMLDELQTRLLEKDACFPSCADISNIHINITSDDLTIVIQVDTQVDTAIPLPSHVKHWLPQQVMVDNAPATGLFRTHNGLWALIPAGNHTVTLAGRIRKQNTLQLPFPLKPHRATVNATGWSVEGVHPDGRLESQLQFKRIIEQGNMPMEILETGILPSFVMVERNLLLGLVWKIETIIKRVSPTGSAIILNIPLLPGESVTTEGVRVKNGTAQVSLQANQTFLKWDSFLEPSDTITLNHPETNDWTEIWKVDVSPIFHMSHEGIPVILHKSGNRWHPTWHPWPGEEVRLSISRPPGVDGQTLTIEKSHLILRPGQRATDASLALTIKSSQGGQHAISLPPNAELQEVKIDGQVQPIRQEDKKVPLPITPGIQNIELKWRELGGIKTRYTTSSVDLGAPSVNASVDVHLSRSRWPLFMGGEQLVGPAILVWSVLLVVILVAFGLSKTGLTPLRFYQWLLLGIGMSMSNLAACLLVVGWLIALEFKSKPAVLKLEKGNFNLIQLAIGALTVLAMGALLFAISHGLLGHPDMNIVGNGSYSGFLRWYQDVSDTTLPQAWVISIPMLAYRIAMLAWALWISFWLVGILKWGWKQFTTPTIWYSSNKGKNVGKS
jgi:hypothetical protein